MDNRAIGIMDSGIGGLTVAEVLHEKYPQESIIFIGDTARNPYGNRTQKEIISFSEEMKTFLLEKQVKMIILACNTITFTVPKRYYEENIPVVGMSLDAPCPEKARTVAILATPATIDSHRHKKRLQAVGGDRNLLEVPLPDLAGAIERGMDPSELALLAEKEISAYGAIHADAALLACTHYPLALNVLKKVMPETTFINPAEVTVDVAMKRLKSCHQLSDVPGKNIFYFTKTTDISKHLVKNMFGDNAHIETISLIGE